MAMLLGGIEDDIIQILGQWKSDTMLRYLHVLSKSFMHNHTRTMIKGRHYDLLAPAPST